MIDLHVHLDGSVPPEDILSLGKVAGIPLPREDADSLRPLLEVGPDCASLVEYLEKFDFPLQVLQTEQVITYAVLSLTRRFAKEGLLYAEIRFAPQLHQRLGLTQQQVVAAAVEGVQRSSSLYRFPTHLILCCMRMEGNREANMETVRLAKEYLGKGVCAVDLAGNEAAFPTEDFADVFHLAEELEVPFTIHAGEAAGPESIWQALELGAKRIGHGIRAIEDPALLAELKKKHIPLEMCFTSNLQTKAAPDIQSYPLRAYLEQGLVVTVNTDNTTVSNTDLRNEYLLLQNAFGLSEDALKAIACNAADGAFLPATAREQLKNRIEKDFSAWLAGAGKIKRNGSRIRW